MIRHFFSIPVFADEEKTQRARTLHFVIWSLLLIADTQFFVFFFLLPQNWPRWLASLLTLNFTLPPLLLLNHRGRTRLAGVLLIAVIWLLGTVLALTAGGIRALVVFMFTVNVLSAGLLFGGRGGVIAGVIFCLTALGFVVLERTGHLPASRVTHTALSFWIFVAMCLEFIAIFQFLANRSIKRELAMRRQTQTALAETEERYREVYEHTSDCIFLLDVTSDGQFVYHGWNPMCENIVGITSAEVTGRVPAQAFPPDQARDITANYQHCVAQGSPIDYEETITSVHEKGHCFHTTLIPVKNPEDRVFRIVGVSHDITERKETEAALRRSRDELEMRVQKRTAELQKVNTELQMVNKELEAFSYSVSHDLRRPLRTVRGFTDLLMSDYARDLPEDARNLLTNIRDGAFQMNQLIEALLKLSRIDRQPLVSRPVNLTALARQTIKELQAEEPGREMDARLAEMPECIGDPALLRQVFVNLLSNAMKFTRTRPVAVIEVSFKTEEGRTIYFVRDNGVGFDMRYADKLFGVFQRVHSSGQFAGTGVGLSIVRRVIHRHGGAIWADAAVDQGATFYFTLPVASPQSPPKTALPV